MIKSPEKLSRLSDLLKGRNTVITSGAIDSLRGEEPFQGAVGLLVSLFDSSEDEQVRKAVELFMNDLKDPATRPEVVAEILKSHKESTTTMLISSCWQSGQDYSDYSEDFINIFLTGRYTTAIECFTVICESTGNISRKRKDNIIKSICENSQLPADKSALASVLISTLQEKG